MTMPPGLRKFVLTAHITSSVGWIGAVGAYLSLSVVTQTSQDTQMVRAAFLAMEPIYRFVLVPLALASLVIGIVQSLGTPWGLFRHYWVLFKLVLTVFATMVLLGYGPTVRYFTGLAAQTDRTDLLAMGAELLHPIGGLVVLLVIMILSVYKPRGMTPYGLRNQREQRRERTAFD